jgi:hypothetical protein
VPGLLTDRRSGLVDVVEDLLLPRSSAVLEALLHRRVTGEPRTRSHG